MCNECQLLCELVSLVLGAYAAMYAYKIQRFAYLTLAYTMVDSLVSSVALGTIML